MVDTTTWRALTEPQKRYYLRIVAAGEAKFNGRARKPLEALEAAGLIECDWDLVLHARGDASWRITAKLAS